MYFFKISVEVLAPNC